MTVKDSNHTYSNADGAGGEDEEPILMVSAVAVAAPAGESMPLASSLATSVTAQPVQGGGATTTTTTYTVPPPAAAGASGAQFMGGLGRQSAAITCPSCQQQTMTRTTDQIDGITVIIAVVLLLLFWPLCWLPFCIPACKSTNHYCTKCHRKVAKVDPCS